MKFYLCLLCILYVCLAGCRGARSEKPPIHINPNMDVNPKYKAQSLSLPTPAGTQPWGDKESFSNPQNRSLYVKEDISYFKGKNSDGSWVERLPIDVDMQVMKRGQERYNIYCAVCHDRTGSGKGLVIKRGFVPPTRLDDDRIVAMKDGELFHIISYGIRQMPAYKKQIAEEDRWAIVAYIRALQKVTRAKKASLPDHVLIKLDEE